MKISVDNLSCFRGGRQVLAGVTFTVSSGQCMILRGANGTGKTTLLRVLAGIDVATDGHLDIDFDQIAYAGHLDAVKAQLTVQENLTFWAGVYGAGDVLRQMQEFGLVDLSTRFTHQLSTGQRRRLGLLRLLLSRRRIWLMDEPTASLDTENTAMMALKIQRHCHGGGIAVVSTHADLAIPGAEILDLATFSAANIHRGNIFLHGEFK